MHKREAIRNDVADIIDVYASIVSGRVFKTRVYPMDSASLPGVCIFVDKESSQLGTTMGSPRTSERVIELIINIYVKADADITQALGDIAVQIEKAIGLDVTINSLALDTQLTDWDESINGGKADRSQGQKTGVGEMTYQIMYDVPEDNPEI